MVKYHNPRRLDIKFQLLYNIHKVWIIFLSLLSSPISSLISALSDEVTPSLFPYGQNKAM